MKDNRGISLVEIIVVVAVLAILSSGVFMMSGVSSGWRVKECSSSISAALNQVKVEAMSKQPAEVVITCDADGNYILKRTGMADEQIAKSNINITYIDTAGAAEIAITGSDSLTISYDRSSGAFQAIRQDISSGNYVYCNKIIVSNGKRTDTIVLIKDTGKHYIE